MKPQPLAQSKRPDGTVVLDSMAFEHLWLGRERLVQAKQRVEHQVGVDMGSPGRTPNRIEQGQANPRNVLENSSALRSRDMRCGENRGASGEPQNITALHGSPRRQIGWKGRGVALTGRLSSPTVSAWLAEVFWSALMRP
jgi:hypothetical protein